MVKTINHSLNHFAFLVTPTHRQKKQKPVKIKIGALNRCKGRESCDVTTPGTRARVFCPHQVEQGGGYLRFSRVTGDNAGVYTCSASNELNVATAQLQVIIRNRGTVRHRRIHLRFSIS